MPREKRTGRKKDGIKIDDKKLGEGYKKMQLRINWYVSRTLQVSPKVGIVTIYLRKNDTKVEKPDFLRDDYVDKKAVIYYFQNCSNCNGSDEEVKKFLKSWKLRRLQNR